MPAIKLFTYAGLSNVTLHVRLNGFTNGADLSVVLNGNEIHAEQVNEPDIVVPIVISNLEQGMSYSVTANAVAAGQIYTGTAAFVTASALQQTTGKAKGFKDFYIAIGEPGPYSNLMNYNSVIALYNDFGIRIKHAPFSPMAKIKNVVVQSWKDEDGDDVYLPRVTGSTPGSFEPAITHEAVEFNPTFVLYESNLDTDGNFTAIANQRIRDLVNKIQGRWLKIWDEYTQIGYEGVYLLDVDDDPKFKRRNYDFVEFQLKFRINGAGIDSPFEGITIEN